VFYEPAKRNHGLPHDPFKAIVTPRPIGWISSLDRDGNLNLAPYSYFNAIATHPPMVMFSSEGAKDSVSNIEQTKEFVCNLATWDLRDAMNKSSATVPHHVNEFELAGLEAAPSRLVKPPRVAASPCALECKLLQIVPLKDLDGRPTGVFTVIGQVVGIHIDERFIRNGILDTAAMVPIARCGYRQYARGSDIFEMTRPDESR
jgi:flavin reductase (DIM6/NTAB) family NADH-FMN oxidoreductase RutF